MSSTFAQTQLEAYRANTYWLDRSLDTIQQAIAFVQERGFIFFWPIKGIEFPSLWAAVAGSRPVASEHDDPGHKTWGWKDSLLGKREWYYAKLLRRKATLVSLELAPYFYALTENYGDPDEDYLIQYEAGRMKQETKQIYEALLKSGAMDTITLRREANLSSASSKYRFERGLAELQADMKILPVGVAEAGAWNYAFIYDLVPRHFPDIPGRARLLSLREARSTLLEYYFRSVGAATVAEVRKLFGWGRQELERALVDCEESGLIQRGVKGNQGDLAVLGELL